MKTEENNENEFLSELSPRLFNKKIVVDAEPPPGYFDTLSGNVMDKIASEEEKNKGKQGKLIQFVNVKNLAIAAGFALLLAFIPFFKSFMNTEANSTPTNQSAIVSLSEIDGLDSYFEESELYEAMAENEIPNINTTVDFEQTAIIEYLIYEDYTEDLLLETIQ